MQARERLPREEIREPERPFEASRANAVLGTSSNTLQVKLGHTKPKLVECMDKNHSAKIDITSNRPESPFRG